MEPTPDTYYLSAAPTANGNISGQALEGAQAHHSLYQIQVNPNNPNQGALLPAPGADGMLAANFNDVLAPAYRLNGLPKPGQDFLSIEKPTLVEKIGENWKVSEMGSLKFSDAPVPELKVFGERAGTAEQIALTSQAEQLANDVAGSEGTAKVAALAALDGVADRAELGPDSGRAAYADSLRDAGRADLNDDVPTPDQEAAFENSVLRDERNKELADEAKANREAEQQERKEYEQAQAEAQRRIAEGDTTPEPELIDVVLYEMQQAAANHAAAQQDSQRQYAQAEIETERRMSEGDTRPQHEVYIEVLDEMQKAAGQVPQQQEQPQEQQQQAAASVTPGSEAAPAQEGAGELQFNWKQKGDEVAPLLEMRAFLDQLKDAGVAVGPLTFERDENGKLGGGFGVSYDPASPKLDQLEAAIKGFKQVGNGLDVVEKPEQATARQQQAGPIDEQQSKHIGEAFGLKQWDALSAQLSSVPKQALSAPEQAQQAAGTDRVQQIAKQRGTSEEVVRDAKSLLDIEVAGNPVSGFLKNFYAHLNGGAKTRQNVEADFDKTRQELQARLTKQAGNAQPLAQEARPEQTKPTNTPMDIKLKDDANAPAPVKADGITATPAPSQAQTPAPKFTEADVPQRVLESLGLNAAELKQSGQLDKLLNGEKTDLLKMQVPGKDGQEAVSFEGKMVLHREADGSATLKMDLPKNKLEIPNEIGGQPFTPEQRQRLETEGTAGLMRGLKDEKGNEFNGYVGVDKAMNKLVVLPEDRVKLTDTIAGVKLSPEQSHDLREGKAVELKNMARVDGGKPFDGVAQIHAAKAGVEVKPATYEMNQKHAPKETQARPLSQEKEPEAQKAKVRGPRM